MKEARIDEILDSIATTSLVYLPVEEPLMPSELLKYNIQHREKTCRLENSIYHEY